MSLAVCSICVCVDILINLMQSDHFRTSQFKCQIFSGSPPSMLLDWKTVKIKMPWDIVLLISGGFALAETTEV